MSWPGDDFCKVRDLDQGLFGAHGGLDGADEGPGLRRRRFRPLSVDLGRLQLEIILKSI